MTGADVGSDRFGDSIDLAHAFMRANHEFLLAHARDTYDAAVRLTNHAIDAVGSMGQSPDPTDEYVRRPMAVFVYHLLIPVGYAVNLDMLAGNLPACFMQLRALVEALGTCYLADSSFQFPFFQQALEALNAQEKGPSAILKKAGAQLGVGRRFVALWGNLSGEWVHTKGWTESFVNHTSDKSELPGWGLIIPIEYQEVDLGALDELRDHIDEFRSLLAVAMTMPATRP